MFALRTASTALRSHPQSAAFLTRASRPSRPSPCPSRPLPLGPPTPTPPLPPSTPPTSGLASLLSLTSASLGSLCGVGGAVFLIPSLVRYLHLPQRVAAGSSLTAVTAIAATSAVTFASSGHIDLSVAAPLSLAATLSTPLGAAFSARLNPAALRRLLGGFMLVLAPVMPLRAHLDRSHRASAEVVGLDAPPPQQVSANNRTALLAGLGAAVGFGSGLLGISGGSLFTPLIAVLCPEASFRVVLGTSFAAMIVPSTVGALAYARMGCVAPRLLPPLVGGAVAGATLGSAAALHAPEDALRCAFAVVFSVMGARILRAPIKAPASVAKRANVPVAGNISPA